jgi:hypothetical protein
LALCNAAPPPFARLTWDRDRRRKNIGVNHFSGIFIVSLYCAFVFFGAAVIDVIDFPLLQAELPFHVQDTLADSRGYFTPLKDRLTKLIRLLLYRWVKIVLKMWSDVTADAIYCHVADTPYLP